ncbi:uncharacterized protein LOC123868829 isoform X4 [Maniola jurtina]|uniref:uncharacterized protein LOC123868829 isoform X4 n=1 Tax=Maniola jurtina TaxID=191418 RepID=UPI001E68A067|nr:uncharacterized protein LOC123868829 isoform X4 [Maniola jurtina]
MINERVDTLYFYKNPFKMELSYEKYLTIGTTWTPLLRQMFVCSGVTINFFIYGLFFGAPTVFVPQIRNEANSTEFISMETASWLFSISSYGSLPWTIIFPIIAKRYGRKVPYIILWINTLICVSLFYFSTSVTELLISGFLQGMCPAVQIAVSTMVLTEYTSPKYRDVYMQWSSIILFLTRFIFRCPDSLYTTNKERGKFDGYH